MLFDTHAHYDDSRFDGDRDELLRSLPGEGVGLVLNPGCDLASSRKAVAYADTYPHVYAAAGIHPENIEGVPDEQVEEELREIEALAAHPKVRAVGEIGLDYYWCKEPAERKRQQELFRAQMRMAGRLGLPVIVHDRDAHLDCLTIAEQYPKVHGVFHCYAGSAETAQRLLELGYYLSFTGVLTFKNAKKAAEVVRRVPLERLMVETDAPYMAPEPFRGKRNSSLYVYRMVEAIAEIKGLPAEEVARVTTENGKKLFEIPE
ncbi:TatD family deoxyribonuclease [Butyricicoccus sp. 1XD8-22]|nr:TatD family deoxyribonuclease [Butyricicoccus sp. 1XD8-22]